MSKPIISIVLGSYNRLRFLKLTIKSIRDEQKRLNFPTEIIVIDGGSTDGTIKWLTKQKDIISIIQHNRGTWQGKKIIRRSWGYFMNLGFKSAQGKYICMVSDDCLIVPNAIKNGYELFEQKLKQDETNKTGALAFYYRNIPFFYHDWNKPGTYIINKVFDKLYLNHGLYLKKALEEVNYIDEENFLFYCADVDLSFKLQKAGYSCTAAPNSYIEHYPHANMATRKNNENPSHQDFLALQKKWIKSSHICPKKAFSNIKKTYLDDTKTIQMFKTVHFTNFEFWSSLIKDATKKKYSKLFKNNTP